MPDGRARIRQMRETRLESLLQDLQSVYRQMDEALDDVQLNKLQRKVDHLEEDIEELDEKLHALDIEPSIDNRITSSQETPQAIDWLSQEQYDFLNTLFQSLSETVAEKLPGWCHDAVPHQIRASIPRDTGALYILNWLLDRSQLSSGKCHC